MSGTSKKSTRVSLRLPNEVMAIIRGRVEKSHESVSDYLRKRIVYDTMRKHGREKK